MKRVCAALLVCLLLCGLAAPMASAGEPSIDVSGAAPLALGAPVPIVGNEVFSYTPEESGWVAFAMLDYGSVAVYDNEQNQLGSANHATVKALADKALYFVVEAHDGSSTFTLTPGQPPALRKNELTLDRFPGSVFHHEPFQGTYIGFSYTVNGEPAPAYGFDLAIRIYDRSAIPAGTYALQFTNYDGENLGTMTVVLEDWSIFAGLREFLQMMQADWNNEDKTTKEWLKLVGNDLLLLVGSPVVAFCIFCCGPMGWILIPVAFQPFIQLPMDIIGLFKSLFR